MSKNYGQKRFGRQNRRDYRVLLGVPFAVLLMFVFSMCSRPAPDSAATRIRVVTQNLGDVVLPRPSALDVAGIFLEMPAADVYLLQEVKDLRELQKIADALSFGDRRYTSVYSSSRRVAILSALPVLESDVINGDAAVRAIVEADDGTPVQVVSIHLPAFRKARQSDGNAIIGPIYGILRLMREAVTPNGRSRSLERILGWLEQATAETDGVAQLTFLGGDFNTVPLTLAPRKMPRSFRDSLLGSGDFWKGTYRRIAGPISARVDFLFHTKDVQVVESFVHPRSTGDHLPIFAEYALRGRCT